MGISLVRERGSPEKQGSLFNSVSANWSADFAPPSVDYGTPGGFQHRQAEIGQDGRNYAVRLEYRF